MRLPLALAFLAVALGLSACGSSGPSPDEEVRAAAEQVVASEDPAAFCRQLASDRLLDEAFDGDLAACVKSDVVEDDPGKAHVSAIVLRGDESRAEVAVSVSGGQLGGVSGHLEFVKEDEQWRLDRFGADYLRSNFLTAIEKVDDGALAIESMKRCVGGQVEKLPAARVRTITYDAAGDDEAFFEDLRDLSEECPAALAEYGARELTDPLYKASKRSPRFIRCVREEIEGFLLLTDVTPQLLGEQPDEFAVATLEGIVAGSKKNCLEG